jgi:glycosyltransferase involved in cell wall biosynthesis
MKKLTIATVVGTSPMIWGASSRGAAERMAGRHALSPQLILSGHDLVAARVWLDPPADATGATSLLIHSLDWSRQPVPQLYEMAAAISGIRDIHLLDERAGTVRRLTRRRLAASLSHLPLEFADAVHQAGAQAARIYVSRPRLTTPGRDARAPRAVVAVLLPGLDAQVGGAVSHMSGILGGLKRIGIRVGLVSDVDPPHQLSRVADEVHVTGPLSRGARILSDARLLAENKVVRDAAVALAKDTDADFIYQRHRTLHTAGLEAARTLGIPLVLEWNSSEVWIRLWSRDQGRVKIPISRAFDPLAARAERLMVAGADVIVAVSEHAAQMARETGAAPSQVVVLPNGVDTDEIDAAVGSGGHLPAPELNTLGWIGSFGAWHGAEVLVEAMARLPAEVTAVMIGDGLGRAGCMQRADDLGVSDRIVWTGLLQHDEALRRLSRCEVLVSPHVPFSGTPFFGSPTKLFEYMGVGRPIVASALEQIGEVLEHDRTAVLVTPGDVGALAHGIQNVLALPDRGVSLGEAARREAKLTHSWDDRAREISARLRRIS